MARRSTSLAGRRSGLTSCARITAGQKGGSRCRCGVSLQSPEDQALYACAQDARSELSEGARPRDRETARLPSTGVRARRLHALSLIPPPVWRLSSRCAAIESSREVLTSTKGKQVPPRRRSRTSPGERTTSTTSPLSRMAGDDGNGRRARRTRIARLGST